MNASKLWNVARWTAGRIWSETGHVPDDGELKAYLKTHERYADLNAQSSQRVIEELAEAFESWYGHRQNGNSNANPPGYRKHGDQHPRSTVTFKADGFKHDAEYGRVRLSKGRNLKDGWSDFVLCEYEAIGPAGTTVENVQQVRAVHEHGEWRLHFVCHVEIDIPESGDRTAGIDLGICNVAAVSFGDDTLLYPGNALREDLHYFLRAEYATEGENGPSKKALWARRKKAARQTHFLHAVTKDVVEQCVERNVGEIAVGHPKDIRADETWGRHGNKRLHTWAFERFIHLLEYKAEERGIEVEQVKEGELKTSKTCCVCGMEADTNRVERGLYVCDNCELVANADCNGAENMRATLTPNPERDRSNGCLAQPGVRLFDKSTGRVAPREQVVCEP